MDQGIIERIRSASDIVDVIGSYLPLKRAGANFVALCPFHKEKSPSFNVSPHRQIFHCFGCHKGGDVFRFVQEYESLSFMEALRRLAERARIPLEMDQDDGARQRRFLKDSLLQMHEGITQRWQAVLATDAAGQVAREYLRKRGVSEEAVKLFRLGAAPEAWDDTVNWGKSKGYDLGLMEQAGLVIRKEGTDRYYDRFRGRLMFPICDEQGRVIGFSGRVLSGDEKTAKYVNSPETPIFTKGRVFFGLDKSRRALLDAGYAVICEGQLDLIACYMAGVQNVVAPQGTAFTAEHARILRRYVEEVVLCFDSDTAGRNATVRVLDDLLGSGLSIRVANMPAPHDPDSYIREHGGEAFRQFITGARGFFEFYLDLLLTQHDPGTDRGRAAVVKAMAAAVAKTGSAVLADAHAQRTAQRLGVGADAVRAEFRKLARSAPVLESRPAEGGGEPVVVAPPSPQEHWLLRLLLKEDAAIAWAAAHLDLGWIQHAGVRQILGSLFAIPAGSAFDAAAFAAGLADDGVRGLVTEALTERRPIPNTAQQLADVIRRLRDQHADRRIAELNREMVASETADERRAEIYREQMALRALKREAVLPPGDAGTEGVI